MKFNTQRTFGVEIEFMRNGNSAGMIANRITAAGVDCRTERYSHTTRTWWKVVSDASLNYGGLELVSPPMMGMSGLRQIAIVTQVLNELECKVDRSCGLHVHHDASDLSRKNIKDLLNFYIRWEPVIDLLMPPSRRGTSNTYCRSLARWMDRRGGNDGRAQTIAQVNGHRGSIENFNGTRYTKLNLEALHRHGTVEFRQHSGTTENWKISSWVVATQIFIERAKLGRLSTKCAGINYEKFKKALGMVGRNMEDEVVRRATKYVDKRWKKFGKAAGYKVKDFVA